MGLKPLSRETCIVRKTDARKGRSESVSPSATATEWLHYGRVILDAGDPPLTFSNGDRETVFICLKGGGTVSAGPSHWNVGRYDAIYIPRDQPIEVRAGAGGIDLAELSAPVTGKYPPAFVSYADALNDPTLHFRTGGPGSSRDLCILIGKNIDAGRLLAGITFSEPGNWTSWPPHEHGTMLEEAYLYIDMPAPAFGVQFVYNDRNDPEVAAFVREGDCVIMPQGYHPNVAAPGGRIGFLWFMAAHREREDRQFGVVNVQPEFAAKGTGLEASRK
jgi:5-deoxy-glucuronate isomerase